jgi:hypothetical protein
MFKKYDTRYKRTRKEQIDEYNICSIEDIRPLEYTLGKCLEYYRDWKVMGSTNAEELYKKTKSKLECINVHNIGDFLDFEFKSTNYLCYDIDGLKKPLVDSLIKYFSKLCKYTMISPSGAGVKLFFEFLPGTITEQNFKVLYRNFGIRFMKKMNNDLGTDIQLDTSSNDLNRLCYIGHIQINKIKTPLLDASKFYTEEELKIVEYTPRKSDTEYTFEETIQKIDRIINDLENKGIKPIQSRQDLMIYGFCFSSLVTDRESGIQTYQRYKRLAKIGEGNTDLWITKSGTGNKYNLQSVFKDLQADYSSQRGKKLTIGSFFKLMRDNYGITGLEVVYRPI